MSKKPNSKLKALRVEHGYTQIDLAKKIGMPVSTYIRKENGYTEFTVSEIQKYALYLIKQQKKFFYRQSYQMYNRNSIKT
ncbi:helix-turn-helix transcriptional regulator [Caloramator sp. Dgby_cultured_2]|uniref:helix-turn-helix transcriptional regulator n=1 Tax=Caloramator sp. Dgby_cultured_2 TaxID=3029174 RepID=UPI00237E896F|nr:helix-turn-helix transcriptional regulator [Caloramator sp. Dgby_cultured_2]WDU84240.1 helix-turn-helix transcriptional regulator [Caloramator sp. Dgby_cultured_2]